MCLDVYGANLWCTVFVWCKVVSGAPIMYLMSELSRINRVAYIDFSRASNVQHFFTPRNQSQLRGHACYTNSDVSAVIDNFFSIRIV